MWFVNLLTYLGIWGACLWILIACLPWKPWSAKPHFDIVIPYENLDLSDITVLIPARNEADVIKQTLHQLKQQGHSLKIILIDDQSTDNTIKEAGFSSLSTLQIIESNAPPPSWSGKLWALEQGLVQVKTKYVLLLDADISLNPGVIASLRKKMQQENLDFASLMVSLSMQHFWEKLLIPAFIYFFKMLYPFQLSNNPNSKLAAAAGGCILVKTKVLTTIGAFKILRRALIDDCILAKQVKQHGFRTWVGLTRQAYSHRSYLQLKLIWHMVTRTAFVQLHYSFMLLLLCTVLMLSLFCFPLMALWTATHWSLQALAAIGLLIMVMLYTPILRYYQLNLLWSTLLPLIGVLYLAMTWHSALRYYWRGTRSSWKGRIYTQ